LDTAFEGQRLRPFLPPTARFLSPDPRIPITLWSGLIGTFVAFLARYAADQVVVQRYFSARSLSDARRGVWLNAAAAVLAIGLLALLGLAVYGHSRATGLMERGLAPPQHLAALLTSMPAGVRGLIAAGILAATMSSIDSGINACSAAWFTDFRNRRDPGPHEEPNEARRGVVFTVAFGTLALGGAFGLLAWIGREQTIFRMVNRVINGLGSPLLALMGLGMFSRRVTPSGIFWGGLVGIACSIFVSLGVENLALHYYAVVNLLLTVGACYVFSLPGMALGHSATQEQLNWTWWHRREGAAHTEGD
jgi:Na+/proline symporter